jgi:hypothetical protein
MENSIAATGFWMGIETIFRFEMRRSRIAENSWIKTWRTAVAVRIVGVCHCSGIDSRGSRPVSRIEGSTLNQPTCKCSIISTRSSPMGRETNAPFINISKNRHRAESGQQLLLPEDRTGEGDSHPLSILCLDWCIWSWFDTRRTGLNSSALFSRLWGSWPVMKKMIDWKWHGNISTLKNVLKAATTW